MPARKTKIPIPLLFPVQTPEIDQWLVVGLDPSLSRTGYALMLVTPWDAGGDSMSTSVRWLDVGSLKPEDTRDPVWVRSKAVAKVVVERIQAAMGNMIAGTLGLIISMEAPTPRNDFLSAINSILHVVLFEGPWSDHFARCHVQTTNAATLRSLMGLKATGAKNKVENVKLAYTFLAQKEYPNLDTDACDAVLMAMMARYSVALLTGDHKAIPERFLYRMCDAREEVTGKGRNKKIRTAGILHRREYWRKYERKLYAIQRRDAQVKKSRLDRHQVEV